MTAGRRYDSVMWLAAPALAVLALCYALPLLYLLARSIIRPEGVTLSLFVQFFADDYNCASSAIRCGSHRS